jgi:hypothetical protein
LWLLAAVAFPLLSTAQSFNSGPYATDETDENASRTTDYVPVFSPNGDGLQDSVFIVFTTTGFLGNYRVLIDTRGTGGVGGPDGVFNEKDDWMWKGAVQTLPKLGVNENIATAVAEWNGVVAWNATQKVNDGTYSVEIAMDAFDNATIDTDSIRRTVRVTVDTKSPVVSLRATSLSPNSDGFSDSATVSYASSEDPKDVRFALTAGPVLNAPAITVPTPLTRAADLTWNGRDASNVVLPEGNYTLEVSVADAGGNVGRATATFGVDLVAPELTSVTPGNGSRLNTAVSEVVAVVNPGSGAALDFDASGSGISLVRTGGASVPGTLVKDAATNTYRYQITSPLTSTADNGNYTITVTAFDKAGNRLQRSSSFAFDTTAPAATRVLTSAGTVLEGDKPSILKSSETLTFELDETGVGVNFSAVTVRLVSPTNVEVPVTVRSQASPLALLVSYAQLSENGTYTLTLDGLNDLAGNVGKKRTVTFTHDAVAPQLISLTGVNTGATLTRLNTSPETFVAKVSDAVSGVDLTKTTLRLVNASGAAISADLENDGVDTVTLRLTTRLSPTGTDDGNYTLNAEVVDKAGNTTSKSYALVYDTVAPAVTATTPSSGSVVSAALSEGRVSLSDATSGVDLQGTTIALLGPNGSPLSVTARPVDASTVALSFDPLKTDGSADGVYTIQIQARDLAGNVAGTVRREFVVKTGAPRIVSVTPSNRSFVRSVTQIVAELNGASNGSKIEVTGPDNRALVGTASFIGTNLTFLPQPVLATDGRDDGVYTVKVTPINAVGTTGEAGTFTFTLDSQSPEVQSVTQIDMTATESFAKGTVSRITATLSDALSGIDTSASSVGVLAADGSAVAGSAATDGKTTVSWQFDVPWSPGGGQDGVYTVSVAALDRAGNRREKSFRLIYDTVAPAVLTTAPDANATVKTALDSVRVDLDDITSGVNVDNSKVELVGPKAVVNTTQRVEGNGILLSFLPLRTNGTDDGTYHINVTAVDRAGNTTTRSVPFYVITRGLRVVSTAPDANAIVNALHTVQATLEERSGVGLDIESSALSVLDASGQAVAGRVSRSGSVLTWTIGTPFPTDGSADGTYTIAVEAVDTLENRLSETRTVTLDTLVPSLSATNPAFGETVTKSLTSLTVQLADAGSGPDLLNTQTTLKSPSGATIATNRQASGNTITLTFAALTDSGTYTLDVLPRDLAGNVAQSPLRVRFGVELAASRVVSISVDGSALTGSYRNRLSEVRAQLEDPSGIGLDFKAGASSLVVTGPRGVVAANVAVDGSTLIWRPVIALATDGADDGNYTIAVTPVDLSGRPGTKVERVVIYDSRPPRLKTLSPINSALAVNYVSQALTKVEATIADDGTSGLDMAEQSIRLIRANGTVASGRAMNDGVERIVWQLDAPLSTDGSMDGNYTVAIDARDRAGNRFQTAYTVVYDTQAPELVSSVPAKGGTLQTNATQIVLTLSDKGGSLVDFSATTATLSAPNGTTVSGILSNDGATKLTFTFQEDLSLDGTHTLRLTLADRAGNTRSVELPFFHAANIPTVVSTEPTTFPVDKAFAPSGLSQVSAKLQATGNGGISLSPIDAEIRLTDASGNTVAGTQSSSGADTLVYRLAKALADDGSDDGTYHILVTPANSAGKKGATRTYTFVYDSQAPEVVSGSVQTLFPSTGSTESIAGFAVDVRDPSPGSGIDWDNVEDSWVVLEDGKGKVVPGIVSGDGQSTLTLVLTHPLASDGSQDGIYHLAVAAMDKAGNQEGVVYEFEVDTNAPTIDATSLTLNDKPIVVDTNDLDYPTSVNSETGVTVRVKITDDGVGADLARSTITVEPSQGQALSGTTRQNGTDTLEFTSSALATEGLYRITVRAVGADVNGLGIQPSRTLGATFLFEKTPPTATVVDKGGSGVFESRPARIAGTATDSGTTQGTGQGQSASVPASGVALVEIGGTGPDGEALPWEVATDDSVEQQAPWSQWSSEFLPSRSGKYRVAVRVTDRAGNTNVLDVGTLEFTTSLAFKGAVYVWPSPSSRSRGDVAHFSFATNQADQATVMVNIYDAAGTLVSSRAFDASRERATNSRLITWNLRNSGGTDVASGIYVWRLELNDGHSTTRKMGRLLVVR